MAPVQVDFLEWTELLFPPGYAGTRRIVLLAGYFDASRTTDDEHPILAVAGYVSTNIQWYYDFSGAWRQVLEENGLEYFHMSDYENRVSPYDKWNEKQRIDVITKLIRIICNSVHFGVGAALFLDEYDAVPTDDRKHVLGTPYHLCSMWCARIVRQQLNARRVPEDVAYVFESGDVGHGEVSAGLNNAASLDGSHVLSVTFAPKEKFPQLQAADILAYETAKQTLRFSGKSSRTNLRKSARALLESGIDHQGEYLGGEEYPLTTLVRQLREAIKRREGGA